MRGCAHKEGNMQLTATLNVWERMAIFNVAASQQGDRRTMRKVDSILDLVDLTKDEKEKVGWTEGGDGSYHWQDTAYEVEVDFKDANLVAVLHTWLNANAWRGIDAKKVLQLFDKLKVPEPESK